MYVLNGVVDAEKKQSDDYEKLLEGLATLTVLHANLMDTKAQQALKMKLL